MAASLTKLQNLAEGQWGMFTFSQAKRQGVDPRSIARMIARGQLERIAHGVYRIRGGAEPDHSQLRAAWLQLDPARPAWERLSDPDVAIVSHKSAAALYGVGDLRADVHEFTAPRRRQTRRSDVRLHTGVVPKDRRALMSGLPTTRAGWMVGDLLADNVDPESVARITVEVIDGVYDYPRVVAESLARHADRFGFKKGDGVALLDDLLRRARYDRRDQVVSMARTK